MERFSMQRQVYCSHLGAGSVVKNSLIVDYLQDTSNLHLETHPVLAPYFKANNCVMFLISRQVDIIRRPLYGEVVTVKTGAYELNKSYGFRNTVIYDSNGEAIVKSIAGGAFMSTETGRPMRVPAEIIEQVEKFEKIEMEYLPRKIALPARQPARTCPVKLRRSDIDMNDHVNNARYFDIADDLIDDPLKATRLRAEYKIPVKLEDDIQASIYSYDGKQAVALNDSEGRQHCILEYSFATSLNGK